MRLLFITLASVAVLPRVLASISLSLGVLALVSDDVIVALASVSRHKRFVWFQTNVKVVLCTP